MLFTMPEPKYRCTKCQYPTPYMSPDGKCPCGGDLVDINQFLKNADDMWAESAFESFPCVLAHEYHRLFELAQGSNIYGVFLQLRDVIETTVKFIALLAVAWGKGKNIDGREEGYEKYLATPRLSLGTWYIIAKDYLIPFYSGKVDTPVALPPSLWNILSVLAEWVNDHGLVSWRNEKLGHGAIGFEDDPAFQQELVNVIKAITGFYREHFDAFASIQLASNHNKLIGFKNARGLKDESGVCSAFIDGEEFIVDPLVIHSEHGIYFFDEVKRKKRLRMLNYQTGDDKVLTDNAYAVDLLRMSKDQSALLQSSVDSEFMTRAENDFITKLGSPDEFVEPEYLTEWLQDEIVGKYPKGVFLLEMERGCGKSVYTERLNRRFEKPLELAEDLDVRAYHLGRAQTGNAHEFTQGVMEEWNSAYVDPNDKDDKANDDFSRYAVLEEDRENPENNSLYMAEYLNKLKAATQSRYKRNRKKRILFVLDGLDEIRQHDDIIWSFLPSTDMLADGVYILLTTRLAEKKELPEEYWTHLDGLQVLERKSIAAESSENRSFLEKYIKHKGVKNLNNKKINDMLQLAEHRVLYLSLLCNQDKKLGAVDYSHADIIGIVSAYLTMLHNQYSESQKILFRRVLCTLSCVACFEPLTLEEIAQINGLSSVTLALLDVMTDLLPLLRVDRGLLVGDGLVSSANRFSLRDGDFVCLVKEYVGIAKDLFVSGKVAGLRAEYDSDDYVDSFSLGNLVLLSHFVPMVQQTSEGVAPSLNDLKMCFAYSEMALEKFEGKDVIVNQREMNLLRQIVEIHKLLPEDDRVSSADMVWNFCERLDEELENLRYYEEAVSVLEYMESLLDIVNQDEFTVAVLYNNLGDCYEALGSSRAEECFQQALKLFGNYMDVSLCANQYAGIMLKLARLYADSLRYEEAIPCFEKSIDVFSNIEANDIQTDEKIMSAQVFMADVFCRMGKGGLAEKTLREAREHYAGKTDGNNPEIMRELANVNCELADVLKIKGELNEAYELDKEALNLLESMPEGNDRKGSLSLAKVCNNLGIICKESKRYDEAYDNYMEALKIYEKYAQRSSGAYIEDVAMVSMNIGNLVFLNLRARSHEALAFYRKSYEIYKMLFSANPPLYAKRYADISLMLAMYLHKAKGELIEAKELYQNSLNLYSVLFERNPVEFTQTYLTAMRNLGAVIQLMSSWNDPAALECFKRYLLLLGGMKGSSLDESDLQKWAYTIFASETVNYTYFQESVMTKQNGWSVESRELFLRLKSDKDSPYKVDDSIKEKAEYELRKMNEFNLSEARKQIRLVRMHYSQLMGNDSGFVVVNGKRQPVCEEAEVLRKKGKYSEACEMIKENALSSGKLSTGTSEVLFLLLATCGDLIKALDYAGYLSSKLEMGEIVMDDYLLRINLMRLVICMGIEEYEGIKIIPYLAALSGNENFQLTEDDLYISLRTGQYLPFIQAVVEMNPKDASELVVKTKELIRSYEKGGCKEEKTDIDVIEQEFNETFNKVKDNVVSEIEVSTDLFYEAQNLKRGGRYKESNELYCKIILDEGYLSTACAVAWFKTLACSGDIVDALRLAQHVVTSDISDKHVANLCTHFYRLIFCIEGVYRHTPIEYLRKISGNPSEYKLGEKDLNVACRTGIYKEIINNCPKPLYREIVRLLP